jgi:hypothetical protein
VINACQDKATTSLASFEGKAAIYTSGCYAVNNISSYEDVKAHMKRCVRLLLKEMQMSSNKVTEFMERCEIYENLKFQNLEEVEYPYLQLKKYYMCKTFSYELATTLENNRFARSAFGISTPQREQQPSVMPSDGYLNFTNILSAAASSSSSSAHSTST